MERASWTRIWWWHSDNEVLDSDVVQDTEVLPKMKSVIDENGRMLSHRFLTNDSITDLDTLYMFSTMVTLYFSLNCPNHFWPTGCQACNFYNHFQLGWIQESWKRGVHKKKKSMIKEPYKLDLTLHNKTWHDFWIHANPCGRTTIG